MATLTIRNVDDELKTRLRIEAARHGHTREEVREILRRALSKPPARGGPGQPAAPALCDVGRSRAGTTRTCRTTTVPGVA